MLSHSPRNPSLLLKNGSAQDDAPEQIGHSGLGWSVLAYKSGAACGNARPGELSGTEVFFG